MGKLHFPEDAFSTIACPSEGRLCGPSQDGGSHSSLQQIRWDGNLPLGPIKICIEGPLKNCKEEPYNEGKKKGQRDGQKNRKREQQEVPELRSIQ
jgi:hypothetical protein